MNLKRKMFRARLQKLNSIHKLEICYSCGKRTMARTVMADKLGMDDAISTACLNCHCFEVGPNPSKVV